MDGKLDRKKFVECLQSSDSCVKLKRKSSLKRCHKSREKDISHYEGINENTLDISNLLKSEVFENQLLGLKILRNMLVKNTDDSRLNTDTTFIDDVIENRLLPTIVKFLGNSNYLLQEEAAWVVTNLATGETRQARYLVEAGAVQALVVLLASGCDSVRERSAWALGNIAGDCTDFRDFVLNKGAAQSSVKVLETARENIPLLQTVTWLLSILCKQIKNEYFKKISPAIPHLRDLLKHWDNNLVAQCCWCLASLSCGGVERISEMRENNVAPHLIPLFSRGNQIIAPVLQVVGNLVTGDDHDTQAVLDLGIIQHVAKLLDSDVPDIRKEVCWIFSNVTAGSIGQVQAVLDLKVLSSFLQLLSTDGIKTKREIVWTLRNIARCGNASHVKFIASQGVIEKLCEIIKCDDLEIVKVVLDTLEVFLQVGYSEAKPKGIINPMAHAIEKCNGIDALETLLSHNNMDIYRKTYELLEIYFNG